MPYMTNGKRDYKKEREKYEDKGRRKDRAARNKARRKAIRAGKAKVGDGKDVHHKNYRPRDNKAGNTSVVSASKNRSFARNKDGSAKGKPRRKKK